MSGHIGPLCTARLLAKSIVRTVQFGPAEPFFPGLCCIDRADEQSWRSATLWPRGKENTMTHGTKRPPQANRKRSLHERICAKHRESRRQERRFSPSVVHGKEQPARPHGA